MSAVPVPPWRAPAGYVPVPSAVEGVEVWAPASSASAPSVNAPHVPVSPRCPQCGASAAFDVGHGALACRFCGFVADPPAEVVGRAAESDEFTHEALAAAEQGWGVSRRELHCTSCGADIAIEAGAITTRCPFCASSHVHVQDIDPASAGLRPSVVLPFSVSPAVLRDNLQRWLGRGWMFPRDLATIAQVDGLVGIYLPFWMFGARLDARWRAEIGTPQVETEYRDGKRRTRTVIRYRWASHSLSHTSRDVLVPGTASVSARLMRQIEDYDLAALLPYTPDVLAGWRAMRHDIALPEAWTAGRARMRTLAKDACEAVVAARSRHYRSFSVTTDFEEERWRYGLLPVYVASYRFQGRSFVVLVNGQTGAVAGQKPVIWWKVYATMAAAFLPALFTAFCLGVPLLLAWGAGLLCMVSAIPMALYALRWALRLHQQASDAEALEGG